MKSLRTTARKIRSAANLALAVALALAAGTSGAAELRLSNDWVNAPFSTSPAEAFLDDDIVHLKGAVSTGSDPVLAVPLPTALRPAARVYAAINLCNGVPGRLIIETTGQISVQSSAIFADAQCFTSLDGARYARNTNGFTPLTLLNGWSGSAFGTHAAGARLIDGIVHLQGAISGGTNSTLFTLPVGMRPATEVYVPVNLCAAAKGRLRIQASGVVSVETSTFADAQCFTSLDGVSFAPSSTGFTNLTLLNGWTNAPFATSNAAASLVDGIVRLKGAVAGGSSALLFQLPAGMRPASDVYVAADLCGVAAGRLLIRPDGSVEVQEAALSSGFGPTAQCFTSLDGVSFVPAPPVGFAPLTLLNGWGNGPYLTQTPSVALYDGIVHFKGAITDGTTNHVFTLPVTLRPEEFAYVSVDLFSSNVGRLLLDPNSGHVTVQSVDGIFATAQSFVSLEGASYDKSATGIPVSAGLTLENGWAPTVFGTAIPGASLVNDIVHFRGAVADGALNRITTLLPSMRPGDNVYLPVGLCGAAKGRLNIQPNGGVDVYDTTAFSDAQCFTSLDGVRFAPSSAGFAPLTPLNGWGSAPFGTSPPAATMQRDIVHLRGAIFNTTPGAVPNVVFTLPPILRPEGFVYTPVDLCNGRKGRLQISPAGAVSVQSLGSFDDAKCFTSLDGASYAVPEPSFATALFAGTVLLVGIGGRRRGLPGCPLVRPRRAAPAARIRPD